MTLAAIVTSDGERQKQAASEHPGARIVARTEELFARAEEIDVVVISTPNRSHVTLARQAIENGLAVVVDKPLAARASEARELVRLARERGVVLTVYQNRRWDGDFRTVRKLVADGSLGDVYRFESRFERWRPEPKPGWRELASPEDAGGLLYDLGTHLIDQAVVLFGRVTHVYAELTRRRAGVEVDDDTFVALTHASGVRSHLWTNMLAAQEGPRFRVLGSRAAFTKHGTDPQEALLRAGATPSGSDWAPDPREQWGVLGAGTELTTIQTRKGSYGDFYRDLIACLRNSGSPPVDPADSIHVLEIIECALGGGGKV